MTDNSKFLEAFYKSFIRGNAYVWICHSNHVSKLDMLNCIKGESISNNKLEDLVNKSF
jgi:hypothetical protein